MSTLHSAYVCKLRHELYHVQLKWNRQMLAVSWGESEVQQLNNAPVYGLYNYTTELYLAAPWLQHMTTY